jgi:trehalose 6-phosphate synthase/phosphatase
MLMASTIIVSNRLPVSVKKVDGKLEFNRSIGGLPTGMASLTRQKGTIWIGWPGIASDDLTDTEIRKMTRELTRQKCRPVFLTQEQIDQYYTGFSNSILWQDFHNLKRQDDIPTLWWRGYREVNELFAETVAKFQKPNSKIWVHDYPLMLLPGLIRQNSPKASVGFFMHIPFPENSRFTSLPQANALMRGLLGADFIGYHTKPYVDNFLEACEQLDIGVVATDHVIVGGHITHISNLPLGIDYQSYAASSRSRAVRKQIRVWRRRYRGHKTILAYGRFDVSKGYVERLRAYQTLLAKHPEYHGKVVMIVIAAPTRTDVLAYKQLKEDVEMLVADINGAHGTKKWQPVDYHYRAMEFIEGNALYMIADIYFETPTRDGMNLMVKEYVAVRSRRSGVLILSKTAGAAEELSDAILVSPTRPSSMVQALEKALVMPPHESRMRLRKMQKVLSSTNPQEWASSFMENLKEASKTTGLRTHTLNNKDIQKLKTAYAAAKSPLFIFDYDGVLTPFFDRPGDAKPSKEVLGLLKNLAGRKGTEVAIISGRAKDNIESWFGKLPITLASEHGASLRKLGGEWQTLAAPADEWKAVIRLVLEKFAKQAPGAFVEEKSYSLVWHYRTASPYYAQKSLIQLRFVLQPLAKKYKLGIYSGKKILEIKPPIINKGVVAARLLRSQHDFVMVFGDDYTDEHMFAILPKSAHSIKVGPGITEARYRLKDTTKVTDLLKKLVEDS